MNIFINGESKTVSEGISVALLLKELEMQPKFLAVEKNRELVPRAQHEACILEPEDQIEIVTLVGGG